MASTLPAAGEDEHAVPPTIASAQVGALVGFNSAKVHFGGVDVGQIKLTYLDIPVLARVNIPGGTAARIHLLAGPSFTFKLNETVEPDEQDDVDDVETFETAFVFGGGVVASHFRIDVRWGFGLTNLDKFATDTSAVTSQVFKPSVRRRVVGRGS